MVSSKIYPYGVIEWTGTYCEVSKYNSVVVPKDATITELYKKQQTNHTVSNDIEFRRKVIEFAISKFQSDYGAWLNKQIKNNPFLTQSNLDFLKDTLHYIRTGERRVFIKSWDALLSYYPDHSTTRVNNSNDKVATGKPFDYISSWLSRDGGFHDMLTTLYYLYGRDH